MLNRNAFELQGFTKVQDLAILTLGAGLLFFAALGQRDLWNPNEPIYGQAVVEMAARGDWMVPSVNGVTFAEKPILYFWGALLSAKLLGGVHELSLRIPSALAGVVSVGLVYLLVLPYTDRRRALLAAALFATQYQVFWAARAVQMDVLVLVATLAVLLPLSRMLDFAAPPYQAWTLAGAAAGLGFAAKGPVTLILPGLVFLGYALASRRSPQILSKAFTVGALVAVAVASPWYVVLWIRDQPGFLFEVLIRQNFLRFVDAWDHEQPWWYYLKYFWLDYAPWSWFVPLALVGHGQQEAGEKKLVRLSWIWILAIVLFFSLSDSKRAPYILPIAPAVAVLAAGVLDRLALGQLSKPWKQVCLTLVGLFALIFLTAGIVAPWRLAPLYPDLRAPLLGLCVVFIGVGLAIALGLLRFHRQQGRRRSFGLAPTASLLAGFVAVYLVVAVWSLPAMNSRKSARDFCKILTTQMEREGTQLASYGLWDWRAEYPFYSRRIIPNLKLPEDLITYWAQNDRRLLIVEDEQVEQVERVLGQEALRLHRHSIGSRTVHLFATPDL